MAFHNQPLYIYMYIYIYIILMFANMYNFNDMPQLDR